MNILPNYLPILISRFRKSNLISRMPGTKELIDHSRPNNNGGVVNNEGKCCLPLSSANASNRCSDGAVKAGNVSDTSSASGGGTDIKPPKIMVRGARSAAKPARYRESPTTEDNDPKPSSIPIPTPSPAVMNAAPTAVPVPNRNNHKVPDLTNNSSSTTTPLTRKSDETPSKNFGVWTEDEQHLFSQGCILHGWGKWNLIKDMIPTRDRFQVKSHAQKFARSHPEMKDELIRSHHSLFTQASKMTKRKRQDKVKVESTTAVPPVMKHHPTVSKQTKMDVVNKILPVASAPIETILTSHGINSLFALAQENCQKPPNCAPLVHVQPPPTMTCQVVAPTSLILTPPNETTTPRPFHNIPDGRSILPAPTNPDVIARNPDVKESNNTVLEIGRENDQPKKSVSTKQSGTRWTEKEHWLFEQGYITYGRGRWMEISRTVGTKGRVQTKTHAQKFGRSHPGEIERLDRIHEEYLKLYPKPPKAKTIRRMKAAGSCKAPTLRVPETREDYVARLDKLHEEYLHKNSVPLQAGKKSRNNHAALHFKAPTLHVPGIGPMEPVLAKNSSDSEWTTLEEKQFEDGCIFHGWGNWTVIASHIFTKNTSQVIARALSLHRDDRDRLEREHRLRYQRDATETHAPDLYENWCKSLLLGTGEAKSEVGSPAAPESTIDEYGAAAAILSLSKQVRK